MNRRPRFVPLRRGLVVLAATLGLAGCYVPTPSTHVHLRIDEAGGYALDGKALSADELTPALRERREKVPALVVELQTTAAVRQEAINRAVLAVREAHATVAFAQAASSPEP